jgi:hypothetical protein
MEKREGPQIIPASVHGPYEDFGIKLLEVIEKTQEGQPADVREGLWRMYLEDVKEWRAFWKGALSIFKREEKE